jgi:hypothetical protein
MTVLGTSVKVALAAAVAAGTLAGCGGGPLKVGAAAIVGDDRISTSTLDQTVRDWQKEFRNDDTANQMRSDPSNPTQQAVGDQLSDSDMRDALTVLVNMRVGDEVARRDGITVTGTQVDQVIAALDRQGGASSATLASGLPKRYTRDFARFLAVKALLVQKYGSDGNPQNPQTMIARQRADADFVKTADSMKIKVNPRYGSFDHGKVAIDPVKYTLSATESGIR